MNYSQKLLSLSSLIQSGAIGLAALHAADPAKRPDQRPAPLVSPELLSDGGVTFRFKAPNAQDVKVAGQFGQTTPLVKNDQGIWSVTVPAVPPGVHEYRFIVDGLSLPDGQNPALKPQRAPGTSILHVPSNPPAFWDWQDIPHGVVHQHEYHSKALGHMRRFLVYTPPGNGANAPLPVLYLSHGNTDNEATWTVHGKAHWIMDALLASKKIVPMIVVMPDAHALPPRGGSFDAYAADNTNAFCRELVEDIVPLVESQYAVRTTPDARAFAGLSMGGHHALTVAFQLHEKFHYIGAFSAVPPPASLLDEPIADAALLNKNLRLLWIACGKDDFLRQRNTDMEKLLTKKGVRYEFAETEGDHSWPVWRRYLSEFALRLFR
ncbi:MAG: hypothetical protein EBS01_14190 [Verrucomicrobia bacterium]|nr:hypothetical protein [Verrucomicrobiota bacterium]